MRCPRCQTENIGDALYCAACNHRLFAWLGDPFGNLEAEGAATLQTRPTEGSAWGKGITAFFFLSVYWICNPRAVWGALLVGLVMVVALWRWPRMSGYAFIALLVVGMLAIPFIGNAISGH